MATMYLRVWTKHRVCHMPRPWCRPWPEVPNEGSPDVFCAAH